MKKELVTVTNFKVVRVVDGDTIEINYPDLPAAIGNIISVRIRGMQAPEIRTKDLLEKALGLAAKSFLEGLIAASDKIVLLNPERGKYFRIIADVILDGHSVRRLMFKAGHATAWDGKSPKHDWTV